MKIRFVVCNSSDENRIPTNQTNLIVRELYGRRGWFLFAYSALHNNKTFNKQRTNILSWNDKKQRLKLLINDSSKNIITLLENRTTYEN